MSDVVQKLWGFCHTLRHDGIDYGDYIEQITYLLFLKMSDERGIDLASVPMRALNNKTISLDCSWPAVTSKSGTDLTDYYANVLRALGQQEGLLGDIFSGAQSRFSKPTNLKKLLTTIDETEWTTLEVNVKADAFEGLLEKAAAEGKKGAGQYFTPRLLIESIVRCMKPDPRSSKDYKICDPACGTGEFLVTAYEWLLGETKNGADLDRQTAKRVKTATYYGQDLVPRPRRLALMNLYLHNLEPHISLGDSIYDPPLGERYDCILTNPPFGTRGVNQAPSRDDFIISTSNKQLNFVQHVLTTLKPGGQAAIVVPDNCLFADKAGEVFRIVTEECNLHTVLRLPNGTFTPYSKDTKTNVVFLRKGIATESVWIYDGRTGVPRITKKERPLTRHHFTEFEQCYGEDATGQSARSARDSQSDRWRCFSIRDVKEREFKLDGLNWLRSESERDLYDDMSADDIAMSLSGQLERALTAVQDIVELIDGDSLPSSGIQEQ